MKNIPRKIICVCIILLVSDLFAQRTIDENQSLFVDSAYNKVTLAAREKLSDLMAVKEIPGLSISVSKNFTTVWCEGFGYADVENSAPVKIGTKFRAGSVSKSMTSIALGLLYDEGKIDPDKYVNYYLPEFPRKKYSFTVRQLAGHMAGIRGYDYSKGEYTSRVRYNDVLSSIKIFSNDSLRFKPGTKYEYTTYGYSLLSAVIEKAANRNFLDFMSEKVFRPMGMFNTVPDYNERIIPERANNYSIQNNNLVNAYFVDNSNKWAGGGFLSTSIDLVRMGNGLLEDKLLRHGTREMLFTSLKLSNGNETGYGLGWSIGHDKSGRRFVYHVGSPVGGKAYIIIFPDEKLVIGLEDNLDAEIKVEELLPLAELFLSENKLTTNQESQNNITN